MVRNMQHTDDPDLAMAVILWCVAAVALAFFGGIGYVAVHFVVKFW